MLSVPYIISISYSIDYTLFIIHEMPIVNCYDCMKIINRYMRLGHNYFIFITNKASLLEYDILVKDNHPRQQTST